MSLSLLFTDSSLLICEKPVGISSESPGLPDLLREQEGFEVYPAHRLDRTTGGACILARSPRACAAMQQLFAQDRVIKEYLAVVSGIPDTSSGSCEDLLYHDPRTNKTFVVDRIRKGVRNARCEWTLLETAGQAEEAMSLLRVILHTGRTHQIRVQFASRGLPLAGDRRYGSRIRAAAPALWSARICFPHPFSPEKTVEAASTPPGIFPWSCFRACRAPGESPDL